jgi:putative FmdB family regulatory protein
MPYYSYLCDECHKQFTLERSISQRDDEAECPHCEQVSSQRLMSLPMVYSKDSNGQTRAVAGFESTCGSCTPSGSCGTCGSH